MISDLETGPDLVSSKMAIVGIAADHGGYDLKDYLARALRESGWTVIDFGAVRMNAFDDYPDFVIPLARALSAGDIQRGIGLCSSGVGAAVAANKVAGVRACVIHETFSAKQGVEDDDLNMMCMGGLIVGRGLAWESVRAFLTARFQNLERHNRRLAKVSALERTVINDLL